MALQILRRLRRGLRRSDLGLHSFDNLLEGDSNQSEDELLIQPMFDTYRALIEQIPKPKALAKWSTGAPTTVVLTGSTGTSDLSRPHLGLDDEIYDQLRARAGLIIHNAWPHAVNFNLRMAAFRQQLAGLINLLALSAEASSTEPGRMTPFLFVSSVSAAGMEQPAGDSRPALEHLSKS
ncbi:hypothetical protein DHEL01_v211123 [Diaporthe helianthi]|uniref:Thioester reductase (TE) domain-containing protein n=1 Tax=Diaporthe helianthi TaxID=158607 RepID=A0A2P5HJP6_DIAHE|nr:hypothetical protein DHEL01_v211123 [Diaporthe helianthi]